MFLQEIFHKNRQTVHLYCFRNIYVKYSHCGPIYFNGKNGEIQSMVADTVFCEFSAGTGCQINQLEVSQAYKKHT